MKKNEVLTKGEFVTAISNKTGFTKTDVRTFIDALEEVTVETLRSGKALTLIQGLTLSRVFKESRPSRNPRTGEQIMTRAKYVPKCKFGRFMKNSVDTQEAV